MSKKENLKKHVFFFFLMLKWEFDLTQNLGKSWKGSSMKVKRQLNVISDFGFQGKKERTVLDWGFGIGFLGIGVSMWVWVCERESERSVCIWVLLDFHNYYNVFVDSLK